jgi:hypothetical protein
MFQTTINTDACLLQVRIKKWSGTRQVPKKDPNLRVQNPPPEKVWRTWGTKAVFDAEELREFEAIAKETERDILSVGTRFLLPGQYVVDGGRRDDLEGKLRDCQRRYYAARDDREARYLSIIEAFIAQNREWESFIRRSAQDPREIAAKFKYEYLFIPVGGDAVGVMKDQTPILVKGILGEVSIIGAEIVKAWTGKDSMSRKCLGPFKRIRDKLDALSFVDPRLQPIVDTIDEWVRRLPKAGPIDGRLFNEGYGLALLLADPSRMAAHGAGRVAGHQAVVATPVDPEAESTEDPGTTGPTPPDDLFGDDAETASAGDGTPVAEEAAAGGDETASDDDIEKALAAIFEGADPDAGDAEPEVKAEDDDGADTDEGVPAPPKTEPTTHDQDGWF